MRKPVREIKQNQHPLWNSWRYIQHALSDINTEDSRRAKERDLDCEWQKFWDFADAVEQKLGLPPADKQLVRKDMKVGWHLSNLTYADRLEKGARQVTVKPVIYKGRTWCAKQLARKYKINYATFLTRLEWGWTAAEAIKPIGYKRRDR